MPFRIACALGVLLSAVAAGQAPAGNSWNRLDASWISVELGGAVMVDGAFFSQDAASKQQVGELPPEGLFRVDELSLSARLKGSLPVSFLISADDNGLDEFNERGWTLQNLNVSVPLGRLATVTVGKQKLGVGMEMLSSGRDTAFLERSTMTTALIKSHVVGVRFSNTVAGGRATWSAGWFNDWLDDGLAFGESGSAFAGRVSGLPIEADGGRRLLHLGASFGYDEAPNGSLRFQSIPEVFESPTFVDTGSFSASHKTSFGAEVAGVGGPVSISGEYMRSSVSSAATGNPVFEGFYVAAAWSLTGETRPYDHALGAFGMIEPACPFSFKHGGGGAWELAARFSSVDLTSGAIDGGRFDRWSGALSWFPTRQFRFEFNYGYGRLERSGIEGRTDFYQLRVQFQI